MSEREINFELTSNFHANHAANASMHQESRRPHHDSNLFLFCCLAAPLALESMHTQRWRDETLKAVLESCPALRDDEQELSKMFAHAAPVATLEEEDAAELVFVEE